MKKKSLSIIPALFALLLFAHTLFGQSTAYAFQGSLQNGTSAANGNHDFEFALFDSLAGGIQVGATLSINNVAVTNGVFSVRLDFGAVFPGAGRYLEIRVRPTGQPGITTLTPRQPIDSSPYSIKSLTADNANTVGGQTAASVANAVIALNSATQANIPNTLVMRNANGDFAASTIFATQQYNIGPNRVLGINGSNNIFAGVNAGVSNTTGNSNAFFGNSAGQANTTGNSNSFVGMNAGLSNTSGFDNSFFGRSAGQANTAGNDNSFFGREAGAGNTTGIDNSFFGRSAGLSNTTGNNNAFFGRSAGQFNTTGIDNSFFGRSAGGFNTTGANNSFFGREAGLFNTLGASNSFFGRSAGRANTLGTDNSFFGTAAGLFNTEGTDNSFFGRSAGQANTTGINNSFFGRSSGLANTTGNANSFFGSSAGDHNTTGNQNSFFGERAGFLNTTGFSNTFVGTGAGLGNGPGVQNTIVGASAGLNNVFGDGNAFFGLTAGIGNENGNHNTFIGIATGLTNVSGSNNTLVGASSDVTIQNLSFATAIGAGAMVSTGNTVVLGRAADTVRIPGFLRVIQLGSPGSTSLCQNANDIISTCSSSRRYKTNITSFRSGLSLIDRLRPVSFNWRDGGTADLGLVAEDVAEIEPLLTTTNAKGEIEGVKYDRIGVVLVNAVKEQQAQIADQDKTIEVQRRSINELTLQVEALKQLVCAANAMAGFCKEK